MKPLVLVLVLCSLFFSPAGAQQITGVVTDAETGEAIVIPVHDY